MFTRAEYAARSTRENPPCTRISAFAERNRNSTASFAAEGSSTSTDCSRILPRICIVRDFDNNKSWNFIAALTTFCVIRSYRANLLPVY